MRRISRRLGAMLLILSMLLQPFAGQVYAAPTTLSGNTISGSGSSESTSNDTYIEPVTGIEIPDQREEIENYIDSSLLAWVEENIPTEKPSIFTDCSLPAICTTFGVPDRS